MLDGYTMYLNMFKNESVEHSSSKDEKKEKDGGD